MTVFSQTAVSGMLG